MKQSVQEKTQADSCNSRNNESKGSPSEAACFFFYCKTCCSAGEMKHAESEYAEGCLYGPSASGESLMKL